MKKLMMGATLAIALLFATTTANAQQDNQQSCCKTEKKCSTTEKKCDETSTKDCRKACDFKKDKCKKGNRNNQHANNTGKNTQQGQKKCCR